MSAAQESYAVSSNPAEASTEMEFSVQMESAEESAEIESSTEMESAEELAESESAEAVLVAVEDNQIQVADRYIFDLPEGWEQEEGSDSLTAADGKVHIEAGLFAKSENENYDMPEGMVVTDPTFPDVMMEYLKGNLLLECDYDMSSLGVEKTEKGVDYLYAPIIITSDAGMSYALLNIYDCDEDSFIMFRFDYEEGAYKVADQCSKELNATLQVVE